MARSRYASLLKTIPPGVWALGFVTLLMNGSYIIIFTLSPLFLKSLGISFSQFGIFEGIVEGTSWISRIFSGVLSDYLHKRKSLLLWAYGLSAISKPIFPLLQSIQWIFFARVLDRLSNGLQATPRDALIGDIAPASMKGACYGLRQTLGWVGSFLGAFILMYLLHLKGNDFTFGFTIAVIPPFLALIVFILYVKDVPLPKDKQKIKNFSFQELKVLDKHYWSLMVVASMFGLANFSGGFMILQAQEAGLIECNIPLVMTVQNLFSFMAAFPVGWLSDRIGRRIFLTVGFAVMALSNICLAMTDNLTLVLVGVGLWGLQMGINQSLLVTKVADFTPAHIRATGFGIFYFIFGVAVFISNSLSGWLYDMYALEFVFYNSAFFALAALAFLYLLPVRSKR